MGQYKTLESKNIRLVASNPELLRAAIKGDSYLAHLLQTSIELNWTEFGAEALEYALEELRMDQSAAGWWTYFVIHQTDNCLIGSGGYAGKPDETGTVEIGYEIAPAYRGQGLATEMAQVLIANAKTYQQVNGIIAHTLGEKNPSTKVLEKCGFQHQGTFEDPEEGLIWKWELKIR